MGLLSFLGMADFLRLSFDAEPMVKKPRIDAAARQECSELSSTGSQTDRTGRTSQVDMKPAVQLLDHVESSLRSTGGKDPDHRKRSRRYHKPLSHYRKYLVYQSSRCRRRMALWRSWRIWYGPWRPPPRRETHRR